MKSLDTNILVYASNKNCDEYAEAFSIVEDVFANPAEWIISDQVMFEFLRALSNKAIFSKPLTRENAVKVVSTFRQNCGARFCAYDGGIFNDILLIHSESKRDKLYDIILAVTLKRFGVTQFFTRNTKDFKELGFEAVTNPIAK